MPAADARSVRPLWGSQSRTSRTKHSSMSTAAQQTANRLARMLGLVAAFNAVSIVLLYSGIPIFGPLNDAGVALAGLLQGVLAWRLQLIPALRVPPGVLLLGMLGGIVAAVGSALVMSHATGWFLAGLVTLLGFALLGPWVIAVAGRARAVPEWPGRFVAFGQATGGLMCIGVIGGLGLPTRLDDPATAPWYL